jgi:glycolate oxidase
VTAPPTSTALLDDLVAALDADRVRSRPIDRALYAKDAGVTPGQAEVIVFPETTAEVAAVVKAAARHGIPVVPRGAGTGLAGGAVPTEPAVVVVLTRMTGIEVDEPNRMAWVEPGVINLDLSRHTHPLGLHFAPDPSSQAACTIGGNVANNSGGPHCLAEGTTVNHIHALEFVDSRGEVGVVGSAAPDTPGLDVRGVLVGSEGTLGIVTRALVKLTPNPPAVRTLLLGFPEVEGAAATVSGVIAAGVVPAALEMMDQPMTQAVERFVHAGFPTEAAAILLAEVTGHPAAVEAEAELVERVARERGASTVRVAADDVERELLWKGRKAAFGAVAQAAPDYYLHDTVVPRTRLVEVMTELYRIAERHDLLMLNVFHAGDGNLHPLMAFDASEPGTLERVQAAGAEIVRLSVEAGGVLSGEHGIGLEKRDLMHLLFSPVDLDGQARLREAFDPDGVFNPGKVLPSGSRCFDFGRPVPDGAWV